VFLHSIGCAAAECCLYVSVFEYCLLSPPPSKIMWFAFSGYVLLLCIAVAWRGLHYCVICILGIYLFDIIVSVICLIMSMCFFFFILSDRCIFY
jgi:hypothetical protein